MSIRALERYKLLLRLTCLVALTTAGACGHASQASSSPAPTSPAASIVPVQTESPLGAVKLPDLTATARAPTAVIAIPAPTLTPFRPPTPVLPLDQTLREFPRDALIYLADNHYLMLADSTGTHQLWLSTAPCLTSDVPSPWGVWSADGRFLVVVCATEADNGRGFPIKQATLFDLDAGVVTRLGSGAAVTPEYSPVGSRLLLNVRDAVIAGVANGERLEAATLLFECGAGTVTRLPVTANWASAGYYRLGAGLKPPPALPRGEPRSAIAWYPDGSRFALVRVESEGGGLYVLDGDGSDPQRIAAIEAIPAYVGIQDLVGWSADGHWLEVVLLARTRGPQTNPDPQRIWVSPDTGEIRTSAPTPALAGW